MPRITLVYNDGTQFTTKVLTEIKTTSDINYVTILKSHDTDQMKEDETINKILSAINKIGKEENV